MSTIERKLLTVRTVDSVGPIEGADAIEVATVGGWQVVVKKGEVQAGDRVFYAEIDSFLPTGNPAWQFLVDKQPRTFEGVVGHRLRTVRLRGQISQGFIVPISALPQITDPQEDTDYAAELGVKKWEQPLPAELAGQAEGLFPSFIRRTDQERCQNLVNEIFQTEDRLLDFSPMAQTMTAEALTAMQDKGLLEWVGDGLGGRWMKVDKAKADPNARYEVTMKMDGSSGTFFGTFEGELGVCSRNLQLKDNEANAGNTFVRLFNASGLKAILGKRALAVQGEVMGPGIQGNRENLKTHKLFIFDMQGLAPDAGGYLTAVERYRLLKQFYAEGLDPELVVHAPVWINGKWTTRPDLEVDEPYVTLQSLGITNIKDLLAYAEGPSLVHPVREGLVFKRMDGEFSFKAISQKYLMAERD